MVVLPAVAGDASVGDYGPERGVGQLAHQLAQPQVPDAHTVPGDRHCQGAAGGQAVEARGSLLRHSQTRDVTVADAQPHSCC